MRNQNLDVHGPRHAARQQFGTPGLTVRGKIKHVDLERGFGIIRKIPNPGNRDLMFKLRDFPTANLGDPVEFEIGFEGLGRQRAINVRVV